MENQTLGADTPSAGLDFSFTALRHMFYIITPKESSFPRYEDVPDYTRNATGWFFVLMAMEYMILWYQRRENAYALNDSITSVNAGILSMLFKLGGRTTGLVLYTKVFEHYRLVDLPWDSPFTWLLCFLTQDLAYYCAHRAIHEAGVFWSFHQMHHSSEYYNLSTSLRQGMVQDWATLWFELLQAPFIPPQVFLVHKYLNVLYQFWLHTEVVDNIGPLEYVLNTPSHHRVHHGRNAYCIDKNYAGTLIIWDRLFGTFEAERKEEPVVYGLVDTVKSFNQLWCQFFEFKALGYDKGQMRDEKGTELFPGTANKIKAAFWPPGWFPGVKVRPFFVWLSMVDSTEGIPPIEKDVIKYSPSISTWANIYCAVHEIALIAFYTHFATVRPQTGNFEFVACCAFIFGTTQVLGGFLDGKSYAPLMELARCSAVLLYLHFAFGFATVSTMKLVFWLGSLGVCTLVYASGTNLGQRTKSD